ncbi:MAG: tryptophan--tRNA ligase [Planctomycetes bacterium]|nr:tryptophan--tRNA ligase [Planctomycetota bacterium]
MRILSGIQPSGRLHLGNYFGAIRGHIALQGEGECFYFIADLHALTTIQNADELALLTREVAVAYLALGLDPGKASLFRQSDVPEVTELAWILSTVAGMGLLERAHAYKDKVARGLKPSVGLFTYPVLMAADILAYDSNVVPVGEDQVQHIEMTRDIAGAFNALYGEVLVLPETRLTETPRVVGTDGQKMSKSYGNTIEIFASGKALKSSVMGIVTDSRGVADPKDPEACNVFQILKLFLDAGARGRLAARYRAGGVGYGEVKKELLAAIETRFAPHRAERETLLADPDRVERVLAEGAAKARSAARRTLERVRKACGLPALPSP